MKTWLLALLLLIASKAQATVLTGTVSLPNGTPVNGNLYVSLERKGIVNFCAGGTPVITGPIIIPVVGGTITGSPDIVPTDCLTVWQPYLVQLRGTKHELIFSEHWYVTWAAGVFFSPLAGSVKVYPTGLAVSTTGVDSAFAGQPVVVTLLAQPLAGSQMIEFPLANAAPNATTTYAGPFTWPAKWLKTPTIVCSTLDQASFASGRLSVVSLTLNTDFSIASLQVYNNSGSTLSMQVHCRGWQ